VFGRFLLSLGERDLVTQGFGFASIQNAKDSGSEEKKCRNSNERLGRGHGSDFGAINFLHETRPK